MFVFHLEALKQKKIKQKKVLSFLCKKIKQINNLVIATTGNLSDQNT